MDATTLVVGLVATGLGGYMAIWPEEAARRDNAGRAADPEPSDAYVLSTRLAGLTLLFVGVPAIMVGISG